MRVFAAELRKTFFKSTTIYAILMVIFLNSCLIFANRPREHIKKESLISTYSYLNTISTEDAVEVVNRQYEKLMSGKAVYLIFTDNQREEFGIVSNLKQQAKQIAEYQSYLQDIQDAAEGSKISIFRKTTGYSKENVKKTADDFMKLEGTRLSFVNSHCFYESTEFIATDIFALILLFYVTVMPVVYEKERGLFKLIRTMKAGRAPFIFSKIGATMVWAVIIMVLLWGSNLAVAAFKYGQMDMHAALQSVLGYGGSGLKISIFNYLILFYASKAIAYTAVGLVFLAVSILLKRTAGIYASVMTIALASLTLYMRIDGNSKYQLLHYINPIPFIRVSPIYRYYFNLNILDSPINIVPIFWMTMSVIIPMLSGFCVLIFDSGIASLGIAKLRLRIPTKSRLPGSNLISHEAYKLLVNQKGAVMLLILAVLQIWSYMGKSIEYNPQDFYYRQYMNRLSGYWSEEKTEFIKDEKWEFDRYLIMSANADRRAAAGEISKIEMSNIQSRVQDKMRPYSAFQSVLDRMAYIREYREANRVTLPMVYEGGYERLLGMGYGGYEQDILQALVMIISMIALLTGFYTMDYCTGMDALIRSTPLGREYDERIKLGIGLFSTTLVFLITYAPELLFVSLNYGLKEISASVKAIPSLANGMDVPLFIRLSGVYLLRYALAITTLFVIRGISRERRQTITSQVLLTGILGIPLAINLVGIKFIDYVSLNPFFSGNMLINNLGWMMSIFMITVPGLIIYYYRNLTQGKSKNR